MRDRLEIVFSPDEIPSCWLSSKHQLTNFTEIKAKLVTEAHDYCYAMWILGRNCMICKGIDCLGSCLIGKVPLKHFIPPLKLQLMLDIWTLVIRYRPTDCWAKSCWVKPLLFDSHENMWVSCNDQRLSNFVLPVQLYLFIQLSVTLNIFQGHTSAKQ